MSDDFAGVPAGLIGDLGSSEPDYSPEVRKLLQAAASAVLDVRQALRVLAAARARRDELYRQLTAAGMSSLTGEREVRQLLTVAGVPAAELDGLGATHDQFRRARLDS